MKKNKQVGKKYNQSKFLFKKFSYSHPKLYKWLINNIKSFLIGVVISFVVTASATTIIHNRQVEYKDGKSVEQNLNELYEKVEELNLREMKEMKKIGCNGCTKLEYLESTGIQYIDTGYIPNQDTRWIVDWNISYTPGTISLSGERYYTSKNTKAFYFGKWSSYNNYNFAYVYGDKTAEVVNRMDLFNSRHLIDVDKNKLYIDGNLLFEVEYNNFVGQYSLYLLAFADNYQQSNPPQAVLFCTSKLYGSKIYDNETVVRDYIPVLDTNDRPCLFDKVSKTCFYNQGTGEFLYG